MKIKNLLVLALLVCLLTSSVGFAALGQGTSGDEVASMQAKLNKLGYGLEVDGKFGPATKEVILDFQFRRGLEMDGWVGNLTNAELDEAVKEGWNLMDLASIPKNISYGYNKNGGSGVNGIQTTLNRLGYELAVDSLYGPKTRVAVKDFQERRGLIADGYAGYLTRLELEAASDEGWVKMERDQRIDMAKGINEVDGVFTGLNIAEKMVSGRTDSISERVKIALAYGSSENINVLLDQLIPPYRENKIQSRFYEETLEMVIGQLIQDGAYQVAVTNDLYREFTDAVTLQANGTIAFENFLDLAWRQRYGVGRSFPLSETALGSAKELLELGTIGIDLLTRLSADSSKTVEMIDHMKIVLPDCTDEKLMATMAAYRDAALKKSQLAFEKALVETGKFSVGEIATYGFGPVMGAVKGVSFFSSIVLGGTKRTNAILRGLHLNLLAGTLNHGMLQAQTEAIKNPTRANIQRVEDAFYVYKNTLIAANKNAMDMKPSSEERLQLREANQALEEMEFEMELYGIFASRY
ncbi:hypothetical protein SANA_28400 [Gottschalkiaceae bacterium SANA]|nr:hypothetical protein SANA_28400 [Gottschalkiaceae bacterium SANA]